MAIFLCGFMGCGKSTISSILSRSLGTSCCDTDSLIVEREGMSIPEIFEKKGEKYFRETETLIVEELSNYKGVAACGGGLMLNDRNSEIARKNGTLFSNIPYFNEHLIPYLSEETLASLTEEEFSARAYAWRGKSVVERNLKLQKKEEDPC